MNTILCISPYYKEEHRWMVSTVKLADVWQKMGYRVVIVCMGKEGHKEHRYYRESASETLTIYRIPDFFLPDPWNYGIALSFFWHVFQIIKQEKPSHIIINKVLFWSSIAMLPLCLTGHRVLLTTDALVGMTWFPRSRFATICSKIYAWTLGWLILRCASKVIFFHPQPPSLLATLGIKEKSIIIPTGVDIHRYSPRKTLPVVVNDGTTLDLVVSYIGRLESVKGVDDFLKAATMVKNDHHTLRIRVVGWYKDGHPLVTQYHDRVEFTGLMKESKDALIDTDIFVLPSHSEGLSNALMEAMSCGVACIASDVGGNSFIIENGISGFLYPAGDIEALASHIRRLIEDPMKRKSLAENARKRMVEKFSLEHTMKEYEKILG